MDFMTAGVGAKVLLTSPSGLNCQAMHVTRTCVLVRHLERDDCHRDEWGLLRESRVSRLTAQQAHDGLLRKGWRSSASPCATGSRC